jgi:pimeloyl-ACP methyl ester carboxylesterase
MLHARPFTSWYGPLVDRLPGWTVLRYRRTVHPAAPDFGIDDDADAVAGLLRHVGLAGPHVVGHSYGGLVALALAMRSDVDVGSLALLEPAATGFVPPAEAATAMAPLLEFYRSAGPAAAMARFLTVVVGDGYRAALGGAVPGAVEDAVASAAQFFEVELPAVVGWICAADDVAAIEQPVLNVVGSASAPRFGEGADLIQSWLPHAARITVDGANHLMIADRPQAVAEVLETFWRSN